METILATTYNLSEQLQADTLDLPSAVNLIQGSRTELLSKRSESIFYKIHGLI